MLPLQSLFLRYCQRLTIALYRTDQVCLSGVVLHQVRTQLQLEWWNRQFKQIVRSRRHFSLLVFYTQAPSTGSSGPRRQTAGTVTSGKAQTAGTVTSGQTQPAGTVTSGKAQTAGTVTLGQTQTTGTVTSGKTQTAGTVTSGQTQTAGTVTSGQTQPAGTVTSWLTQSCRYFFIRDDC